MIYIEIDDEGEAYVCPLISGDITKGQPFNISSENVNAELTRYIGEIHEALKGQLVAGPLTSEKPQQ
jgi:hypothetical protein